MATGSINIEQSKDDLFNDYKPEKATERRFFGLKSPDIHRSKK